ncbi:hypothetical protein SEA_ZENTENO07_91 [Mycobacterium phage Zenteno07]|nr:hypothetical protein SEA_ZENTENO07_91 [Mycobacterium phage Zenteno07]
MNGERREETTEVRETVTLPAVSLHSHAEGQPCDQDCRHYPASTQEQVTTFFADPLCTTVGRGFCSASVDGYCVGGYDDSKGLRRCHG